MAKNTTMPRLKIVKKRLRELDGLASVNEKLAISLERTLYRDVLLHLSELDVLPEPGRVACFDDYPTQEVEELVLAAREILKKVTL